MGQRPNRDADRLLKQRATDLHGIGLRKLAVTMRAPENGPRIPLRRASLPVSPKHPRRRRIWTENWRRIWMSNPVPLHLHLLQLRLRPPQPKKTSTWHDDRRSFCSCIRIESPSFVLFVLSSSLCVLFCVVWCVSCRLRCRVKIDPWCLLALHLGCSRSPSLSLVVSCSPPFQT